MTHYINSLSPAEFFLFLCVMLAATIQIFLLIGGALAGGRFASSAFLPGLAAIIGGTLLFAVTR